METSVLTGKVIRFDEIRGYGFVAPDAGSEDVFLHVNELNFDKRLLTPGTRVQFVAEEGERGLKASRVQILNGGTPKLAPVPPVGSSAAVEDDEMCDILSTAELLTEFTELLLTTMPAITAEQIVSARQCMLTLARSHGWIED